MSLHDKTLIFFQNKALAASANTSITSKLIDLRLNGDDINGKLFVKAYLGAAATDGYVTFKLQTSANGSDWVDVISCTNKGATLYEGRLPLGLKRYCKCTATVGANALAAATTVWGEITDTLDVDLDTSKVQNWAPLPTGDLAKAGDTVRASVES